MRWDLVFERQTKNRLNPDTTRKKLRQLVAIAGKNPANGFRGRISKLPEPEMIPDDDGQSYRYQVRLRVEKPLAKNGPETIHQFQKIVSNMRKRATAEGWQLTSEPTNSDSPPVSEAVQSEQTTRSTFDLPQLSQAVIREHFRGVYERDAHIRTIHSAVQTCIESNGEILSHVLLYGQPGACKTKLTEKLKAWYEVEDDTERVLFVDGTTMTKAGLENWLLELEEAGRLPEVLVVDELEKQPMDNLLCLNAVMGSGMLTKLNARIGNTRKPAKFVVIGICNDKEALRAFRNGALWSRFTHKLPCVRPSKELSLRILKEMTVKIPNGKPIWAEKAMEFGWDKLGQRDIREIKGHLDGRDRLLDGSWQKDQLSILASEKKEIDENKALQFEQERLMGV